MQDRLKQLNKIDEKITELDEKEAVFGDNRLERIATLQEERQVVLEQLNKLTGATQKQTDKELEIAEKKRLKKLADEKADKKAKELKVKEDTKRAIDYSKFEDFMAQATTSRSKEVAAIAKAMAIYNIGIKTSEAAIGAYSSLVGIDIVGPFLAVGAASAAMAFGLEQANSVANQQPSFETGGVVGGFGGATAGGDNTTANVRTGEMLLNADEQKELFDVASGDSSAGGDLMVNVNIDGKTIMNSTVKNYNTEKRSGTLEVDFI